MFVYTFWEPSDKIPWYLQMCMETWKKYLPNATIVVLDYKNISDFLDICDFNLNLFSGRFSLPIIADAIRVALLAKHGGVWVDVDTIVLNSSAERYFLPDDKHRTCFFGYRICFINTPPGATLMRLWLDYIREKIWNLTPETQITWDFLGNKFVNPYLGKYREEVNIFDVNPTLPEQKLYAQLGNSIKAYVEFYFNQNLHLAAMNTDLLLLHNSWTPADFKKFSPQEVLNCDCTMSNILMEALNITPPPYKSFTLCRYAQKINFGCRKKKVLLD